LVVFTGSDEVRSKDDALHEHLMLLKLGEELLPVLGRNECAKFKIK